MAKKKILRPLGAADLIAVGGVALVVAALWRVMSWWIVALVVVPAVAVLLIRQSTWLRAHRRGLAPLEIGLGVAGVAVAARWVDSPWIWPVLVAVAGVLAWANAVTTESGQQRTFRLVAIVAGAGWFTACQLVPLTRWADLVAVWLLLLIVGYGFHLTDRKVIAEVKVEEKIRSWPEIVKGTELAGTWRSEYVDKPSGGWRMRIGWAPGQKMLKSVRNLGPLFESLMDAPVGSVSVESGDRPNEVAVECSPVGALGALVWDGEPAVSIMQPVAQSRYGDGTFETYARWERGVGGKHKLLAGATRCLAGDTEIIVNRNGIGRAYRIDELVAKFNGQRTVGTSVPVDMPRYARGAAPELCTLDACSKPHHSRGLCTLHHQRWRHHGDPLVRRTSGPSWDLDSPTYVQREVDGVVRLAQVKDAWSSGFRTTYTVTTDSGRTIRATDQHPFATERGWVKLGELVPGDRVRVRTEQATGDPRKPKNWYVQVGVGPHHPRRRSLNRMLQHRLVAEARVNGMEYEPYLAKVRAGDLDGCTFLGPEVHVHHKDENPRNNDPDNLEVLIVADHLREHDWTSHMLYKVGTETVESVEVHGMEETYDIEVVDDPHNFIANGFVVHNSGKSVSMKHDALTYGAAEDVILWLIDLKGGASLRPLAPLADWFETTTEGAVEMLEAGARLCDARAHLMAEKGWDPWQPSREYPVILIKIDETAKLLGMQAPARAQQRALSAAITIGQQGAGLGILIDPATQYATLEALGSSQFREQLMLTECYRLRSEGSAAHFLPNAPAGVEPASIPASSKGAHYADIEGEFRPLIAQKFNVTDEQLAAVVGEYWDSTPEIEAETREVLGEAWENRQRWAFVDGKVVRADATDHEMPRDETAEDEEAPVSQSASQPVSHGAAPDLSQMFPPAWAEMDDTGPTFAELDAARDATLTPEERAAEKAARVAELEALRDTDPKQAPALILRLMREVAPEPLTPGEMRRATKLSETTIQRLLHRWRDEGRVVLLERGKYQLTEHQPAGAPS